MDLAADTVEQALERARREDLRLVVVEALRVQVLIAMRREQVDLATYSLVKGLTLARAMPYTYGEARLLHLDGLLQLQLAKPEAARERQEKVIFSRLGARMDNQRADLALGAL